MVGDPKETAKRLKSGYSPVAIPKNLANKIGKDLKKTGFETVSDYVAFVLREIFGKNEDVDEVRKRLKKLGYL
ncbi:CopG family transcriptional regulator [Candidatus Micrarchaeota archaeon CG_4_10_14_0_2_um_filter_55_9]|nr:MAG: CopG family transcriptional regulator [Candidatus Micrarchaeota archaeon CG09_land_8_20_14_0_10_55_25]PIZ91731.1 MAG: CopG family transcriptional regulator [Candidatus Micrarchaeota archaeon CG_4_10_14_0_2_um_filter_55_9]PJD01271.1 MAG: CopG family transcriptional regulator [Candidatus Micrarchaeota archaeon CG10_big_fil_rev_8_21_14_0_10_54_18]